VFPTAWALLRAPMCARGCCVVPRAPDRIVKERFACREQIRGGSRQLFPDVLNCTTIHNYCQAWCAKIPSFKSNRTTTPARPWRSWRAWAGILGRATSLDGGLEDRWPVNRVVGCAVPFALVWAAGFAGRDRCPREAGVFGNTACRVFRTRAAVPSTEVAVAVQDEPVAFCLSNA
jgi:hypothetical protein